MLKVYEVGLEFAVWNSIYPVYEECNKGWFKVRVRIRVTVSLTLIPTITLTLETRQIEFQAKPTFHTLAVVICHTVQSRINKPTHVISTCSISAVTSPHLFIPRHIKSGGVLCYTLQKFRNFECLSVRPSVRPSVRQRFVSGL